MTTKGWMGRQFGTLLTIAVVLWIASPFFYYAFSTYHLPENSDPSIEIPGGYTLKDVAKVLEERKIIDHPDIFMLLAILTGHEEDLKAGMYRFEGELSLYRITDAIIQGRVATRRITIPEGYTFADITVYLSRQLAVDEGEIRPLETDRDLLACLGLDTPSLEGFLFPDTYTIPIDATPRQILEWMIRRYHEVFSDSLRTRASSLGLTQLEAVTLASIIERETRIETERRMISGVFHNRLGRGMPLEADPTVRYALGKYKGHLLYKDLEVDSPYNTYRYAGLPPGPICSPGKASILAALDPEEVDYLYFVATPAGTHIFSRPLAQHNRAKRRVSGSGS